MRHPQLLAGLILIGLMLQAACTSRYRLDLNMITGNESYSTSIESSQYVLDAGITDPYADNKWARGNSNLAILGLSVKGRPFLPKEEKFVLDNQLRCRLYIELPREITGDAVSLPESSFLQILGRYDWPADETIFPASGGTARIDSVVSSRMFITLHDARFVNSSGRSVVLAGQLKFKIDQ